MRSNMRAVYEPFYLFIYLFIYLLPHHMTFNNVIVEDTDKLSNLLGIVRDPTGRSPHWLA